MNLTRRQSLALVASGFCSATKTTLTQQWREIAAQTDGTVGAAALHLDSGQRLSLHGNDRFPLASVCKLPIAINVLAIVDEGKLSLNDDIDILLQDVVPGVSNVAERWPKQRRFLLNELPELLVAKSDNTAVQILFRLAGGHT